MKNGIFSNVDLGFALIDELYSQRGERPPDILRSLPNALNKHKKIFLIWATLRRNLSPEEDREVIRFLIERAHKLDKAHRRWFGDLVTTEIKRPNHRPLGADGLLGTAIYLSVQKLIQTGMKPTEAQKEFARQSNIHFEKVKSDYYNRSKKGKAPEL